MYKRALKRLSKTFFLLGPRGTGKSTWLAEHRFDLSIDLLSSRSRLELERDPCKLEELVGPLKKGQWVLIDEIQKVPALLDEVHRLYETKRLNFALSGSSARKLKRSGANLLGGRALNFNMYPLIWPEHKGVLPLAECVDWGTLPLTVDNHKNREATLEAYVDNYLRQELIEEAILRKVEPFSRFLQVAAIFSGQVLNAEAIARDAKVPRSTVSTYLDILEETLLAFRLPAYRPALKTKEVSHPKLYFFDSGVARSCAGLIRETPDNVQRGVLFETFLLNEIRAYQSYANIRNPLYYYATTGGGEIDLIVQLQAKTHSRSDRVVAMEFKYSSEWDSRWSRALEDFGRLKGSKSIAGLIGIYRGKRRLRSGNVDVYPAEDFLENLHSGKII